MLAGQISAAQAAAGGSIAVAAGVFVNSGQLHADGPIGGQINIRAGNILNAGPITADGSGPGGNGGQVQIAFTGAYVATTAGMVSASSATGPGGQLTLDGGNTGHLFTSGRQLATGLGRRDGRAVRAGHCPVGCHGGCLRAGWWRLGSHR